MNRYVEFAIDKPSNRGYIRKITDTDLVKEARAIGCELYRSLYLYDEEILEHFKVFKTVRSYRGTIYVDKLLIDIDYHKDIMRIVNQLVDRLFSEWKLDEENTLVYFSGRGFHITIPDIFQFKPSPDVHLQVKATMQKYFPEGDNIYDKTRIVRVQNTINVKTNLYKIPLTLEELKLTYQEICELAREPRRPARMSNEFPTYPELIVMEQQQEELSLQAIDNDNSRIITCIHHILNNEPIKGERHLTILAVASALKREGLPKKAIYSVLRDWLQNEVDITEYELKRTIDDVFNKNYQVSCKHQILAKHCDSKCIFYKRKDYGANIDIHSVESNFKEYINSSLYYQYIDLYGYIKKHFKIYPQQIVTIIGDTGINKSTLLLNLLLYFRKPTLYINTENSSYLTFRRAIQIQYGMTKEEVEEYYKHNDNGLSSALSFLHIYSGIPHVTELERLIMQYHISILAIDVLGDIDTGIKSEYESLETIIRTLRGIAEKGIIVFAVHHTNKNAGKDSKGQKRELDVHDTKGNSVVEQKSDIVLGLEGLRTVPVRKLRVLKGRDEIPFEVLLNFNSNTYQLTLLEE